MSWFAEKYNHYKGKYRVRELRELNLITTSFAVITIIFVLLIVALSGCSHTIDGYTCKCDCGSNGSSFECSGKEKIIKLKGGQ
jgi:hypothetical protein